MKLYKKGDVLVNEGDISKEIFILFSGKIGVYKGDIKICQYNKKGIIIGEMSAILGEPRTASLRALENSTVGVISSNIDSLIEKYPEIAKKILINLAERLKQTTKDYWILANEAELKNLEKGTEL